MKKGLFLGLLILLLVAFVSVASSAVAAEFNVTAYGAVPGDGADDSAAINAALEAAHTSGGTNTVIIPEGSWNISSELLIFSDTTLKATSATINSSIDDGPMLREGGPNAGGYGKAHDITVEGGTWIANESASKEPQILAFHHCRNITIRNLTCKRFFHHAINLSGVDTATVSGVTIADQREDPTKTGHDTFILESVHLDYCDEEGEPFYGLPYDNTGSKNITVTNCTFSNVFTAVGNHHPAPVGASKASNILVTYCTFNNVKAYMTSINGVNGMKVNNNTATDSPVLAFLLDAGDLTISNNTVDGGNKTYDVFKGQPDAACTNIYLNNAGKIDVSENTIKNFKYNAVKIQFSKSTQSESVISNNTISSVSKFGMDIRSDGNNKVTVNGNKLSGIGDKGITIGSLVGAVVSGNTVESSAATALHIIGSDGETASVTATDNILSCSTAGQGENYDVFVNKYTDCTFTGNTLKHRCFHCSKGAKVTADFPKLKTIVMEESYVYTGSKIEPKIQVEDDTGMVLTEGVDYKVEYKHNLRVGDSQAKVKVKGISFTMFDSQVIEKKFVIIPWKIKSLSVKAGKKQITVKWKLDKKNDYEGYEIEYGLKKSFKDAKSINIKNIKDTSTVIKKLKKGKTYYVRGRVWKKSGGKKYYSEWSDTLKVKVK